MIETQWPPKDGRAYIRSDDFGQLVVEEVLQLSDAYPRLDLADSVATTFQWFNSKLNANRSFISKRRFPTIHSFRAYVRQMLYNAGMRAVRLRKNRKALEAVPESNKVIDTPASSAQQKEELLNFVNKLEEPHKTILSRYFFDEEPLYIVAGALDMEEAEALRIYEEAVDQIRRLAKKLDVH